MNIKTMDVNTRNIVLFDEKEDSSVFHANNRYVVPLYQREYEWGEEEIRKFIHNLIEVKSLHPDKPYFMGTLQFNINENGVREIVDGQQRLITLLLFIKYLEENINNCVPSVDFEKYTSTIEINNSKCAKNLLLSAEVNNNSSNKFSQALFYIDESFQSAENESKQSNILNYVKNIYFVMIETKQMPLSEIISIFNIINTTGMDLGTKDIFKVQYFTYLKKIENKIGSLEKDEEIMNNINAIYQAVEAFNDEIEAKNIERRINENVKLYPYYKINIDILLDTIKTAIIAHKKFPEEGIVEKLKMGTQSFFEEFFMKTYSKELYEDILSVNKIGELLEIIKTLYKKIYFADQRLSCCTYFELLSNELIWETRYGWRGSLYTFPYVYLFIKKYHNKSLTDMDYAEALKYNLSFAKYLTKKSLINDRTIDEVFRVYANAIKKNMANLNDTVAFKEENKDSDWEEKEIERLLESSIAKNKTKKRIICVLSGIFDEIKASKSIDDIWNNFYNRENKRRKRRNPFEIEHIKASNNIPIDKEELYNSIGNLVVLESNINESIKDKPENKKIEKYKESRFSSVENIIKIMTEKCSSEWSEKLASDRKKDEKEKIIQFLFSSNFSI